ncbi:Crp/Fnr family transcriptional regulator [Bacillus sp. RD4P76]|uniref:Crp/Fnr family transcriptional regulator n=1 Tax=Bacillus suaedaesalsae TaxID=2810349 RepID=A0ABS2DEX7_9BACI|nr:Crp/Fnr family transcriptional regulator [Bacillus suaedaesalsae]
MKAVISLENNGVDFSTDLRELLTTVHHEKKISKGNYLFQEGDSQSELYLIRSGKVQIGKVTPDGRELTFRICGPDDLVGEITLFCSPSKYMVNAKVLEDGVAAVIRKADLEDKLLHNHKLAIEFMKWMGVHYQKTQTKFRDLVLHGKKGALYSTLIRMTNSYGVLKPDGILINLVLTNQELANFCGMTREVVNRMLSDLKKAGKVSMIEGKIMIHDLQFLKDEIDCEDCPIEFCNID